MFLYDFFQHDRPLEEVQHVLAHGEAWLGRLANEATAEGDELRVRLGLTESPWALGKQVRVLLGDPYERPDLVGLPVRWEATGPKGLFPVLTGDLELSRLGPDRTHVALVARYEPPMGSLGRLLDRKLLHHVAEAAIRSFLRRLEATVEAELAPSS